MNRPDSTVKNIVSWSGGKDSTATIILAHESGIKIDEIIISLVWFDKSNEIYGENPDKLDWIINYAKPLFESWGYPVTIVTSDKDYMFYFFHIREKSKHLENIGKYYGFLMGGACCMQREKVNPIKRYIRENYIKRKVPFCEIVGICADEPERIERMRNRNNQISLLAQKQITQEKAMQICRNNNLLSPTYTKEIKRDGCWFCPNQRIQSLAELKTKHSELWEKLKELSKVKNTIARGFKYGETFEEIERKVDDYIRNPPPVQLSLFDMF
jgi:3'-phosphoadenosine 5'-phosphosulfate sulfotransferase (PAPS reductase)/FAD synthetase